MDNDVKNIIILPSDYDEKQKKSYPVLYYYTDIIMIIARG